MHNKRYSPVEEVVVEEVEEVVEEVEEEEVVIGKVANCSKLNVRKGPSKKTDSIKVLEEGTLVFIDKRKSSSEFYRVNIENGNNSINGYCMKKFIEIQE